MITPQEIQQKALRLYPQFVKAWLRGEEFFPKRIPSNRKPPTNLADAKRNLVALRQGSKENKELGYTIIWEMRNSRTHGRNEFPAAISFECESDLLSITKQSQEFAELKVAVAKLREQQPLLEPWLLESIHWKDLITVANLVDDLLLVTQYLIDHPRPDCFAREIPLPISTKLIEENRMILSQWLDLLLPPDQIDFRYDRNAFEPRYGLRHVRHHILLRCLDTDLQQELGLRFDELSLPVNALKQLILNDAVVFVVENKVNLLTLPPINRGIAIGGIGKAISLLRDVPWLRELTVYYWGDLDVEGFEMLSQFREMFPNTQSVLMDMPTLQKLEHLQMDWTNHPGPSPHALSDEERATYHYLFVKKIRLEQERIPQTQVNHCLNQIRTRS